MPLLFFCHRKQLVPFCVIRNSKEFPMTQKSRGSSTDRGFLCYTYRSIRPARSVFHAHKYDSTSYTCRSSSYSSAWLYSDASDLSPFSLYSLIPDRNYLFMKIQKREENLRINITTINLWVPLFLFVIATI